MTEAETLFNESFVRSWKLWAAITNFRESLLGAVDIVTARQKAQIGEMYDKLVHDPEYQRLLVDPASFAEKVDRARFVEKESGRKCKEYDGLAGRRHCGFCSLGCRCCCNQITVE